MKPLLSILILGPFLTVWAQIPDLDAFTKDLDLSLSPESTPTPPPSSGLSRLHLFDAWEAVASFPTFALPEQATSTFQLVVPKGTYLVAPNTARISNAYRQLSREAVEAWTLAAPLKVVLHADGKVSVAIRVTGDSERRLPPGLDLSPLPELKLVGKVVDVQVADRAHPLVLQAFSEIRSDAMRRGWKVGRREFFFFPLEPGKVWFGLKVLPATE